MIRFYYDRVEGLLVPKPGFSGKIKTITFKRGDKVPVEVFFLDDGEPVTEFADPPKIKMAVKKAMDSDLLAFADDFDFVVDHFEGVLPVDSEPMSEWLVGKKNMTGVSELTFSFDSEASWITSQTLAAVVENDVIKGDEEGFSSLPDPSSYVNARAVRFDVAQELSDVQKLQIQENIGTGPYPSWSVVADKPTTFPPAAHTHTYSSLTGIPADFPPAAHTHAFADLTGKPTTLAGYGITDGASTWDGLTGKPTTFPPTAHTHTFASLTSKPTTLTGYGITDAAAATHTHTFASLTGKPTTLAGYGITDGAGVVTLTGDVTGTGAGSFATTLATVNADVGTFGSPTEVPIITVDAKGRITAVSTAAAAASTLWDLPVSQSAGIFSGSNAYLQLLGESTVVTGHPGPVAEISTGTAIDGFASIYFGTTKASTTQAFNQLGSIRPSLCTDLYAEALFSVGALSVTGQSYQVFFGFANSDVTGDSATVSQIGFLMDAAGVLQCCAKNGASTSTIPWGSAVVPSVPMKVRFHWKQAAGSADFYVNDVFVDTITLNLPTSNMMKAVFRINKQNGTTGRWAALSCPKISLRYATP